MSETRDLLRVLFHIDDAPPATLPFAELRRLTELENAVRVVAVAEHIRRERGDREKARPGFDDELVLAVTSIRQGSADIGISRLLNEDQVLRTIQDEYEQAIDEILDELDAIPEGGEGPADELVGLPSEAWRSLERFARPGRGRLVTLELEAVRARDGEKAPRRVRLTGRRVSEIARRASMAPEMRRDEFKISGRVYRVNRGDKTFGLWPREQRNRRELPLSDGVRSQILRAVAWEDEDDTRLLWIRGTALYDGRKRLIEVDVLDEVREVKGPPLTVRVDELRKLEDGWWGEGTKAPTGALLDRVQQWLWEIIEEIGVDRPYLYPTPEGSVQAEWPMPGGAAEVVFPLKPSGIFVCQAAWDADEDDYQATDARLVAEWLAKVLLGRTA